MKISRRLAKQYDKALALYNAGELAEAERLLITITEKNPRYEDAWSLLGVINYNNKKLNDGMKCFKLALEINPKSLSAMRNLASMELAQNNNKGALHYFERALKIDPNYPMAHVGMGLIMRESDEFKESLRHFEAAIKKQKSKNGLSKAELLGTYTRLSVMSYISWNYSISKRYLNEGVRYQTDRKEDRTHLAYLWVLAQLLLGENEYKVPAYIQEARKIFAIGDSHILSMHGQIISVKDKKYQVSSRWIEGVKQWHLGKSSEIRYKNQFQTIVNRLPLRSLLIMSAGEIDCRENEGIITAAKKLGKSVASVIKDTVDDYIDYLISTVKEYGHQIIIWGIPASNAELKGVSEEDRSAYLQLLIQFNDYLKTRSIDSGLYFADIFALTNVEGGQGNGEWHIDKRHVKPVAVIKTFEKYLSIPNEKSSFRNTMTEKKLFLHVGCGQKRKDQTSRGFNTHEWKELRFDIDETVEPDIVGTMLDMSAVESESVDAIYSSHNIEHLYPHEIPRALSEFLRVLDPEGFLVLTCPDLQSVAKLIAEDKLTEAAYTAPAGEIAPIDILYGHRPQLARGNLYMAHKCGFTLKVLVGTLQANGFKTVAGKIRGYAPFFDLWVVASKNGMSCEQINKIAGEHFPA